MYLSKQTKRREKKRMMSMLLAMLMLFSGIFGMLPGSGAMKAYAADVSENEVSENVISENEVYENAATENEISENDITEPDLSENTVSENDSSEGYVIMEPDDELEEVVAVTEPEDVHYEGEGFRVDFVVQSSWENHYNAVITVTNTSDETLHNWGLSFESTDSVSGLYNVVEPDGESEIRLFKNAGWNQDIPAGGTVFFGYTASYEGNPDVPQEFAIASVEKVVNSDRYEISCVLYEEWESGGLVQLIIENISDTTIEDWRIEFDFAMNISEIWDGVIISHEGQHYQLQNADYAQNIAPGESHIVSMIIEGELGEEPLTNLTAGEVVVEMDAADEEGDGEGDAGENAEDIPDVEDIRVISGGEDGVGQIYYKEISSMEDIVYTEDMLSCVRNQFLLMGTEGAQFEEIENLVAAYDARIVGYIETTNVYQVEYNYDITPDEIEIELDLYRNSGLVELAMLNYIAYESSCFGTTDSEWNSSWTTEYPYGNNWGIEAIDMEGALIQAGVISGNNCSTNDIRTDHLQTVRIGLIDSCFDVWHEDLSENFVRTWNDFSSLEDLQAGFANDAGLSHGTFVAGIMAAGFNNGVGITGVCIKNELYGFALDVTNSFGMAIMNWNSIMKTMCAISELIESDVKVINYSRGYGGLTFGASQGDESAISFLEHNVMFMNLLLECYIEKGYDFLIVTSAGNNNNEKYYRCETVTGGYLSESAYEDAEDEYQTINTSVTYGAPNANATNAMNAVDARYDSIFNYSMSEEVRSRVIVVGAVMLDNSNGRRTASECSVTSFSNVGDRVDILAPGQNILSCMVTTDNGPLYIEQSGTSAAAPFVAGVVGLAYNVYPEISAVQLKNIIVSGGTLLQDGQYLLNASYVIQEVNRLKNGDTNLSGGLIMGRIIESESSEGATGLGQTNGGIIDDNGEYVPDEQLVGIGGVCVTAQAIDANNELAGSYTQFAVTDENGYFTLPLSPGRYYIVVEKPGYLAFTYYYEMIEQENAYIGTIVAERNNMHDDISDMIELTDINLCIRSNYNETSLQGATIQIREGWDNRSGSYADAADATITSDANGHCTISLPRGRYTAEVKREGYVVGYYNVVADSGVNMQYLNLQPDRTVFCTIDIQNAEAYGILFWRDMEEYRGTYIFTRGNSGISTFCFLDDILCATRESLGNAGRNYRITLYENVLLSEYVKFELTRMNGNLSQSSVRITITYPDGNVENIQWNLSEPGMVWDVFQIENGELTILDNVTNEPTLP